ncbi:MAG: glucokinase [Desulfocapsaceae bacterium]|nr:glucokinase [Desulfocapsaceae bacterium]
MAVTTLLSVDVGGTKVALALSDLRGGALLQRAIVPGAGHKGISEIIRAFLDSTGLHPDFACLGVAGVVKDGAARITNRPWLITEETLVREFSLSGVRLINDMTALCAALPTLTGADLLPLQTGRMQKKGTKAVIAPGTGLGEGYLIEDGPAFLPRGSEGGHADFAPVDDEQIKLLRWLRRRARPVSYEMLCSGLGIPSLYDFCKASGQIAETEAIKEELNRAADPTPVILAGAIAAAPCPLCLKTMELFLSILGSEAGNLALKLYATGGLYIGGGIPPRLSGHIPFTGFLEAFRHKAKMEDLMAAIPVHLIIKPDTVLSGAIAYGRRIFLPCS